MGKDNSWMWIVVIGILVWYGYSNGYFQAIVAPPENDTGDGCEGCPGPADTCNGHVVPEELWDNAHEAHIYCSDFSCPLEFYNNGTVWPKGCFGYPSNGFDENWNPMPGGQYKTCYCESLV